jgi:membrane protein DedA with SNARE-associated domain
MTVTDSSQFLERYGVFLLPALAVAEQMGIPIPAVPALLAVGVLAAQSRISIPVVLGAISVAALAADLAWYELGRRRGATLLKRLCGPCVDPCSWLRRAESFFGRYGVPSMLAAKFVPGLTAIVPPLAGVFAVTRLRFVLYDLTGVLLWAGTWLALGYFCSSAILPVIDRVTALGHIVGVGIATTAAAAFLLVKYRRRLLPVVGRRPS